jgi:N-acetylglucosamine malate deacetylase 1
MNKILVVVAHQDDEVLGCGATIARHTSNRDKVQVVFIADGFSSRDINSSRDNSANQAAKVLGCEQPIFFNFPDNQLDMVSLLDIVKKIESIVNDFKPNIVYTHHFGDLNVDHKITHQAVMTACRPQPDFCVREIYSFEVLSASHWQSISMNTFFNPNYFVDITDFLELKLKALECYDDEMRKYPHARSYKALKNLAQFRGSLIGLVSVEAFNVERLLSK